MKHIRNLERLIEEILYIQKEHAPQLQCQPKIVLTFCCMQYTRNKHYFIPFYSILFYSILLYSILFTVEDLSQIERIVRLVQATRTNPSTVVRTARGPTGSFNITLGCIKGLLCVAVCSCFVVMDVVTSNCRVGLPAATLCR